MHTIILFFLYGLSILLLLAARAIKEGTPPNPAAKSAIAPDFMNALRLTMVY
jgi:hypothetical protein